MYVVFNINFLSIWNYCTLYIYMDIVVKYICMDEVVLRNIDWWREMIYDD